METSAAVRKPLYAIKAVSLDGRQAIFQPTVVEVRESWEHGWHRNDVFSRAGQGKRAWHGWTERVGRHGCCGGEGEVSGRVRSAGSGGAGRGEGGVRVSRKDWEWERSGVNASGT